MKTFIAVSLLISGAAFALPPKYTPEYLHTQVEKLDRNASNHLDYNIYRLSLIKPGCFNCTDGQAGVPVSPKCRSTYEDLYKNDVVDVTFVAGYSDSTPLVEDRVYVERLKKHLRQPECHDDEYLCGFTQDQGDMTLMTKIVQGPDGKMKTIRLHIASSADTDFQIDNVVGGEASHNPTPAQALKSRLAHEAFLTGLKTSDAVIYTGHARGGSGPGFDPPHMVNRTTWDLEWHRKHPTSRDEMVDTLAARRPPLKMLGLFACYAQKDFAPRVHTASPDTGIIASEGEVTGDGAFDQSVAMLDSIVAQRCENIDDAVTIAGGAGDGKPGLANTSNFFHLKPTAPVATDSATGALPTRVLSSKPLVQEAPMLPTGPAAQPAPGSEATDSSKAQGTTR